MGAESDMWLRAKAGEMPAEALPRHLRHRLLHHLSSRGWSLDQIADWTKTDSAVVARILTKQGVTRQ